jgi:hypothetical protein
MDTNEVEVRRGEPNRRGVVFAAVAMSIDLARWLASPERSGRSSIPSFFQKRATSP